ncbi:MAG: hypothetical protein QOC92_2289 [Acidimicrobiaceae bacterium]
MSDSALLDAMATRERRRRVTGTPWSSQHRERVLIGNGAGLALVFAGWFQSAVAETAERPRLTWLAVSISGLVVSGSANATWLLRTRYYLSGGREVVRAELREALRTVRSTSTVFEGSDVVVAAAGSSRYHRPSCQLMTAKPVVPITARQRPRLVPCEMCFPVAEERAT